MRRDGREGKCGTADWATRPRRPRAFADHGANPAPPRSSFGVMADTGAANFVRWKFGCVPPIEPSTIEHERQRAFAVPYERCAAGRVVHVHGRRWRRLGSRDRCLFDILTVLVNASI